MKQLIIMQGVPGSGKSTLAGKLGGAVFSTDDFFTAPDGDYRFNPKQIAEAHHWNQARVLDAMKVGEPLIIVDNTNTQAWEARPYVQFAHDQGYQVEFISADTPWAKDAQACEEKGTHGVPLHAIEAMLARMEPLTVKACLDAKAPWEKT